MFARPFTTARRMSALASGSGCRHHRRRDDACRSDARQEADAVNPPASRQRGDALERGRPRRIRADARDESAGAVADPRDPPRGDSRRAQRHRPPVRGLHAGARRSAGCVRGCGGGRGCPRGPGRARARPGGARGRGVRPCPRDLHDGTAKTAGIAAGRAVRAGDADPPTAGRARDGHAAGATCHGPVPGSISSRRRSTSQRSRGGGACQPFVIDLREHVRGRAAASVQRAVRPRPGVRESHRRHRQHDAHRRAIGDRAVLVRGFAAWAGTASRTRSCASERLDPWSAARAFALVNFAMADGFIAGFDAKYRFRFWRPVTAIHEAATDGNPLTEADATWQPFLTTPPVPDYPSTHTVLGCGGSRGADRALRGQGALQRDEPDAAGRDATIQGVLDGGPRRTACRESTPASISGTPCRDGHRQGRSIGRAVAEALEPVRGSRSAS